MRENLKNFWSKCQNVSLSQIEGRGSKTSPCPVPIETWQKWCKWAKPVDTTRNKLQAHFKEGWDGIWPSNAILIFCFNSLRSALFTT